MQNQWQHMLNRFGWCDVNGGKRFASCSPGGWLSRSPVLIRRIRQIRPIFSSVISLSPQKLLPLLGEVSEERGRRGREN
jgi:hypothetical protein